MKKKYIHKIANLTMNRAMPITKRVQQDPISTGRMKEQKQKLLKIKK